MSHIRTSANEAKEPTRRVRTSNATMSAPRKNTDDKTKYRINPTSPSPPHSPPSLAPSLSASSTSPTQPTTPPRGRSSSKGRYPPLGRVPLHRRGTSKTYERLEDLLREAGYKETRIFTPETERGDGAADPSGRADGGSDTNRKGNMRGGVGAVVGFLAALMPGSASRTSTSHLGIRQGRASLHRASHSPPASPLAHKQTAHSASTVSLSTQSLSHSSDTASPYPRPPQRLQVIHHISQNDLPHPRPLSQQPSDSSLRPSHLPPVAHPQPSRAGAYLRHMASAPNMPKRPKSAPFTAESRARRGTRDTTTPDGGGKGKRRILVLNESDRDRGTHPQPPLPATWLEAVARAVLFGGSGAHVGGPSTAHPVAQLVPRPPVLRQTKSSLSQVTAASARASPRRRSGAKGGDDGALSDHTNVRAGGAEGRNGRPAALPPLASKIHIERAGTSEGEVSRTRVVCRSAPVSRAGSRVRGGDGSRRGRNSGVGGVSEFLTAWMDEETPGGRKEGSLDRQRRRRQRDKGKADRVPSLASTRVEGDLWSRGRASQSATAGGGSDSRYLSGWAADGGDEDEDGDGYRDEGSSSEEEGELDLARLLVPPKRQNSIRSLRRHLQGQPVGASRSSSASRKAKAKVAGTGVLGMTGMGSQGGSVRGWREGTDVDEEDEELDEEWGQGWGRKRGRSGTGSDGEEGGAFGFGGLTDGTGSSAFGKRRRAIPGPWTQWTAS